MVVLTVYVGVEHRIKLAANAQYHIRILFILFSILSPSILWYNPWFCEKNKGRNITSESTNSWQGDVKKDVERKRGREN